MKAYFAFKDCKRSFREKEKLLIPGDSKIILILICVTQISMTSAKSEISHSVAWSFLMGSLVSDLVSPYKKIL